MNLDFKNMNHEPLPLYSYLDPCSDFTCPGNSTCITTYNYLINSYTNDCVCNPGYAYDGIKCGLGENKKYKSGRYF